jgi:hypothetical protein
MIPSKKQNGLPPGFVVMPVIRELQAAGATSHNAIARKLNARNVPTARGRRWTHVQAGAMIERASN